MRRLLALLALSIAATIFLVWLQAETAISGNRLVLPLVWTLIGALLILLLMLLARLWASAKQLEEAAVHPDTTGPQQTEAHVAALARNAAHLSTHADQELLLRAICRETADALDVPAAMIWLYDPNKEQFTTAASVGLPPQLEKPATLPLAWLRAQAGQSRGPTVVRDLAAESQIAWPQALAQAGLRSLIVVELVYRERPVGLLLAGAPHELPDMGEESRTLLRGLADQTALAIANTHLLRALRQLAQRTRRQTEQVQRLMETVPDGLLVLDHDLRPVLSNRVGREMVASLAPGYTEGQRLQTLAGLELADLLHTCAAENAWRELALPDAGQGSEAEAAVFELTARRLQDDDDGRWIVVLRDTTAERQRRQAAESQDRLATVGQLAAGIAHDFNNIMAVITLYSQTLERNPDFPKRREYLATISKQAQHASALISQIVEFSRAEEMEWGRLDLLPFVKEMVKLLQRTLPENIQVTLAADAGEYEVKADPALLRQAIMNLALNARDAMPHGGELQLSLAALTVVEGEAAPVRGMAAGRYMGLSVADTGEGMSRDVQSHAFEPFFSTKQAGKGTGMGLAQVFGIVKRHGGEIEVDSGPGRGARVTLYLPAPYEQPVTARSTPTWPTVRGAAPTVLLAEDHDPTREAIRDTLELLGYNVLVATTGREALAMYEAQPERVDLVLSDMVMPEMGGLQLYRELMARDPRLKMMVMTGYPLENEGRALLEQGIVDWIRKPFAPDVLGEKIAALLEAE